MSVGPEQLLRQALQYQSPPQVEMGFIDNVVKAAAHRRRRRVVLSTAAVLVGGLTAAVGLTDFGSDGVSALDGPADVIPWVPAAAPVHESAQDASPQSPTIRYSACTSQQLKARAGGLGVGVGQVTRRIILTNVSTNPCSLAGFPTMTARGASGSDVPLSVSRDHDDHGLVSPANIEPGENAELVLTTPYACEVGSADVTELALSVSSSTSVPVTLPSAFPLRAGCGVGASSFGTQAPVRAPSRLSGLRGDITFPDSVTGKGSAQFTVTLSNPTGSDVDLAQDCPSYEEFLVPASSHVSTNSHAYYLNCAAGSRIPAGGSLTFAIQVPVPDAVGEAKFGWILRGSHIRLGGVTTIQ